MTDSTKNLFEDMDILTSSIERISRLTKANYDGKIDINWASDFGYEFDTSEDNNYLFDIMLDNEVITVRDNTSGDYNGIDFSKVTIEDVFEHVSKNDYEYVTAVVDFICSL